MSITVDGRTYRTLSQPIRLGDGRQVKEVWQDGRKVYPDLPRFAYALKLAGKMNATFMYAKEISYHYGGILSDGDTYEVKLTPALMATNVEVTVLSDYPIEVYEGGDLWVYPSGSEPSTCYHSGWKTREKCFNGHPDTKSPPVIVPDFPKPLATYAFHCPGNNICEKVDGDYTTCENHTHAMVRMSSTNSAVPRIGATAGAAAYTYFEKPMSNIVFNLAQGREVVRGFHPEGASGLDFRSGSGSGSIRAGEVRCKTEGMRNWSTCGFVQYVALPASTSGWEVDSGIRPYDHLLGYLPLNELIYNNNPPVTSPTFSTDPPTEEVPESILAGL